jgi:hypothetical protein
MLESFTSDDNLYDWISVLVQDRLYYGSFPNQAMMNQLVKEKFDIIINLTRDGEEDLYRLVPSPPGFPVQNEIEYIHYPIDDNQGPDDYDDYCCFITWIKYRYFDKKKIYIHCRGGHGRSSMVSVSVMYTISPIEFHEAIRYVNESHNNRVNLRNKWRKRKSPFNTIQYYFLTKMHKNIYVTIAYPTKYYGWLFCEIEDDVLPTNITNDTNDTNVTNDTNEFQIYQSLYHFFHRKLEPFAYKMKYTYLKKFVLVDASESFRRMYCNVILKVRESLCRYI